MVDNRHGVQGVLASSLLFVTATQGMAPLLWSGTGQNPARCQLQCHICSAAVLVLRPPPRFMHRPCSELQELLQGACPALQLAAAEHQQLSTPLQTAVECPPQQQP